MAAVRERGEATTAELRALDPRLGQKLTLAPRQALGGDDQRLPEGLLPPRAGRQDRPRPPARHLDRQPVPLEPDRALASRRDRRDAGRRGPGRARPPLAAGRSGPARATTSSGGPAGRSRATKRALAAVEAIEVDLDGGATGYVLPDDADASERPSRGSPLLPALDATTMGWTDRDWYLGPHGPALFDRNGNAGPTIWVDGRIVGGWAQRSGGEIAPRLLEDVGVETRRAIDREAARLADWIGPASVQVELPDAARDRAQGRLARRVVRRDQLPIGRNIAGRIEHRLGARPRPMRVARPTASPRARRPDGGSRRGSPRRCRSPARRSRSGTSAASPARPGGGAPGRPAACRARTRDGCASAPGRSRRSSGPGPSRAANRRSSANPDGPSRQSRAPWQGSAIGARDRCPGWPSGRCRAGTRREGRRACGASCLVIASGADRFPPRRSWLQDVAMQRSRTPAGSG